MQNAPYFLDYTEERDLPKNCSFDTSDTFCAQRANGEVRFDQRNVELIATNEKREWVWPNLVPVKQVTLIEGAPSSGKTFVALDIVARTSRGLPWPEMPVAGIVGSEPGGKGLPRSVANGPARVLYIGGQDDEATLGERLKCLGADMQQILHFREFRTYDPQRKQWDTRPLSLPYDLPAILDVLENQEDIGLIVIDPISDFCDGPKQLADTLRLLNGLAKQAYAAIVVTLPAQTRFDSQGELKVSSRWRTDGARCVWTIAVDPEDHNRRLLIPRRINFCESPRGVSFQLTNGKVAWELARAIDPSDPLGQQGAIEDCLHEIFRDGTALAADVYRLGGQCGFSAKQIRATAKNLGIRCRKLEEFGGGWQWVTAEKLAAEQLAREKGDAKQGEAGSEVSQQPVRGSFEWTNGTDAGQSSCETGSQEIKKPAVAKNTESLANSREIGDSANSNLAGNSRATAPQARLPAKNPASGPIRQPRAHSLAGVKG